MKNATFEMAPNTRLIRQRLQKTLIGDVVSYKELSGLVSEPVSGGHPALQSAIRSLLHADHLVFGVIRGEGLRRLADTEIVAAADGDIDGLRRRARKAVRKITSVGNYAAMSTKDQLAHTTRLSIFTAVSSMASDKGIKKVEAAATGRATELPIADTLRAFMAAT